MGLEQGVYFGTHTWLKIMIPASDPKQQDKSGTEIGNINRGTPWENRNREQKSGDTAGEKSGEKSGYKANH